MLFGQRLRIERKKNKFSAESLALACEISRSYITLMENGKRLPGKKLIPKIAQALNLKTSVVVNWYLESIREQIE